MGFGFKVENRDFSLTRGELDQVIGEDKLRRDLGKVLTVQRKGRFGQELYTLLGTKIKSPASQILEVRRLILEAVQRFVDIQSEDETLSDAEVIESSRVFVYPDPEERTQIKFVLEVITRAGTELELSAGVTV